mmetsp:Transcript_44618/g.103058  ORF Transcript_44618/g.103058 Transcript_44618/m.103058 type:complete len:87 (-) Transcript_44618:21-281(-)
MLDCIRFHKMIDDALLPLLCRLWHLPALTDAQAIERMMECSVTGTLDVTADALLQGTPQCEQCCLCIRCFDLECFDWRRCCWLRLH